MECSDPHLPPGTFISNGIKSKYMFGDTILLSCLSTYECVEETQLQCQQNNAWSGNFPICKGN